MTIDSWMDKEVVVYSYNGILLGDQKWNLAICNKVGGTGLSYAKQNMSEKDTHPMISLICRIE